MNYDWAKFTEVKLARWVKPEFTCSPIYVTMLNMSMLWSVTRVNRKKIWFSCFQDFHVFHTKIALWALQRFSGDILHLVKTWGFEQKTSNSCQSTIQSPRALPMEDPAPSVMSSSLSVAMKRGTRDQNFPEPIILGNVISSTHLSNDSSSWKANKQAKFNMQSFTDCVLVSWLVLSSQVHVHVIALSIIY